MHPVKLRGGLRQIGGGKLNNRFNATVARLATKSRPGSPAQLIAVTVDTLSDLGYVAVRWRKLPDAPEFPRGWSPITFLTKTGCSKPPFAPWRAAFPDRCGYALHTAPTPRERIQAIIDANLGPSEFDQRNRQCVARLLGAGPACGAAQARSDGVSAAHALQLALHLAPGRTRNPRPTVWPR